jgi:hypothetical protein
MGVVVLLLCWLWRTYGSNVEVVVEESIEKEEAE